MRLTVCIDSPAAIQVENKARKLENSFVSFLPLFTFPVVELVFFFVVVCIWFTDINLQKKRIFFSLLNQSVA